MTLATLDFFTYLTYTCEICLFKGQQGNHRKNIIGVLSRSPTEPKTNTRDLMTTQPFGGGDYSALSQWAAGLKPHYIVSGYGFNLRPDIDWSTAPRQDFRCLNRRGMNISLTFRYFFHLFPPDDRQLFF